MCVKGMRPVNSSEQVEKSGGVVCVIGLPVGAGSVPIVVDGLRSVEGTASPLMCSHLRLV